MYPTLSNFKNIVRLHKSVNAGRQSDTFKNKLRSRNHEGHRRQDGAVLLAIGWRCAVRYRRETKYSTCYIAWLRFINFEQWLNWNILHGSGHVSFVLLWCAHSTRSLPLFDSDYHRVRPSQLLHPHCGKPSIFHPGFAVSTRIIETPRCFDKHIQAHH